jgi:hypothetical protein
MIQEQSHQDIAFRNSAMCVRLIVFTVILLATILEANAAAYLDPGSGSMVVQAIIAAVATIGYAVRTYWSRIRQGLGRANSKSTDPARDV